AVHGGHLHLELHDLPGPPSRHPGTRRQRHATRGDPERDAGHDQVDRGAAREPSASGRVRARSGGAATVPRRPRAARAEAMTWRPALVALDVDGTLLHLDGTLAPGVAAAVDRARAAGAHVVIATG